MSIEVQLSSVSQSCPNLCNPMDCSIPGFSFHHQLSELAQLLSIKSVMPSNHLILCWPLLFLPMSPYLSAFNLFQHQGLFQGVISSHQVAKLFEFQLQHQPLWWISGLISFRIDWLDFLSVHRILKSLLQHHSSKASIPRCSAFFMVQLSHSCMTTWSLSVLVSSGYMSRSGNAGSYGSFISRF